MSWLRPMGRAMRGLRAGMHGLASRRAWMRSVPDCIIVTSTAFGYGVDLPDRFTASGEGVSPPLAWEGVPPGTAEIAVIVEDADVPIPIPLTHAVVYGLPASARSLAEGAISARDVPVGRNSLGRLGWLPPTPPPGHGPHHYAFQVFALDEALGFDQPPGRAALLERMRGRVIGVGTLFGVYEHA